MRNIIYRNPMYRSNQKGAITMFSAVLILILLTEMIFYAVQVGVFEQRKSSNEMKQKLAFHTADSGVQVAKQFLSAHSLLASSSLVDRLPDVDGWLAETSQQRWVKCSDTGLDLDNGSGIHPCFGEPDPILRKKSWFYSFEDDATALDYDLPLSPDNLSASGNETVTMHALLCMLDTNHKEIPPVWGCTNQYAANPRKPVQGTGPEDPGEMDSRYFMITILARGQADCENDGTNCGAEAMIADKIGSYGPGGKDGGPGAPLVARTNVPLSGTVEIVPNPNGGGVGVPISSWVNDLPPNNAVYPEKGWCAPPAGTEPISPDSGSYATCEAHEWYGQDTQPTDYKCPTQSCSCDKTKERMLTYASGSEREMGIDIVPDPEFPCDLWGEMFGMSAKALKDSILELPAPKRLLEDCSSLDESSIGPYWVSGPTCDLKTQIGGPNNPVLLISAVENTKVSAGAELFGVLFVTDIEVPGAEFTGNGHGTVYGAVIMDATMEHFNGTFQIVYVEDVIDQVLDAGLFGAVAGGWTDFHAAWK
jgi:hypothetical protein